MSHRPTFDPEVRERLYRTIRWIAEADGVNARERETLARLRDLLQLDPATAARLDEQRAGPPERIDDPEALRALCCLIAQVVAADGVLSPEERARAESLVPRLDLDAARLDQAIMDRLAPRH